MRLPTTLALLAIVGGLIYYIVHWERQELSSKEKSIALAKPLRKVNIGETIRFSDQLSAMVVAKSETDLRLEFNLSGDDFDAALNDAGAMPLPPYIAAKRPAENIKQVRHTTNGTTVPLPGQEPRRLPPGETVLIAPGALVSRGDEAACTYEVAG